MYSACHILSPAFCLLSCRKDLACPPVFFICTKLRLEAIHVEIEYGIFCLTMRTFATFDASLYPQLAIPWSSGKWPDLPGELTLLSIFRRLLSDENLIKKS